MFKIEELWKQMMNIELLLDFVFFRLLGLEQFYLEEGCGNVVQGQ